MKTSTQLAMEDSDDPSVAIPEILLPVQVVELFQRSSGRMPELALMAAVLEDAILSFCRCADSQGVRSQRLFQETAEWFESHDVTWPFAFENICDALALEPEWIRGLLRRWQDKQRAAATNPLGFRSVRLRAAGSRHIVSADAPTLGHLAAVASSIRGAGQ